MPIFFGRKRRKVQFGLINCMNNRGLGTESRLLRDFFRTHFPEVDFHIHKIPAGRKGQNFDDKWQESRSFRRWLNGMDIVMTIEQFMPKLYRACREQGIRTIWRPNQEWISPCYGKEDFEEVDVIMTPQNACADFLEQHFGLDNVVRNPWITELPVNQKWPSGPTTHFLFNAGRGGVGERRNHQVVIEAFSHILEERPDIHFTLKTQVELDVSSLEPYRGKSFTYIHRNTSYSKNLAYYRKVDFSVAPSKWEGLGFAILESLYCGTPVLTTDAAPMNEWVRHKQTGYLVPVTFPDIELPIPFDRVNLEGVNWVRAALCEFEDIVDGIHWLADNRTELYESFNRINSMELSRRKAAFIECFRGLIEAA